MLRTISEDHQYSEKRFSFIETNVAMSPFDINIHPGIAGFCFFYYCAVLGCEQIIEYVWPDGRTDLFAYNTASLSSLCRCIRRYWTSKMLVGYIMLSECITLSQFFMQYMGPRVFRLPIYLMMIVMMRVLYIIIITKSVVWPICHLCLCFASH